MLNDAQVLLLDEPTAFLDASASDVVRSHIQDLEREGKTIMFVTQRLDEVTRLISRILVIREGKLVSETTVEGLYGTIFKGIEVSVRLARAVYPYVAVDTSLEGPSSTRGWRTRFQFPLRSFQPRTSSSARLSRSCLPRRCRRRPAYLVV